MEQFVHRKIAWLSIDSLHGAMYLAPCTCRKNHSKTTETTVTLWLWHSELENGPFTADFPSYKPQFIMDCPVRKVLTVPNRHPLRHAPSYDHLVSSQEASRIQGQCRLQGQLYRTLVRKTKLPRFLDRWTSLDQNWGPNFRMAETKDLDKQNMFMIFREKKRPKRGIHFLIANCWKILT